MNVIAVMGWVGRVGGRRALAVGVAVLCGSLAAADSVYVAVPQAGVTYIDVRPAASYARSHVPRSLNVPLYALKTSPVWIGKQVILLDDGWGDPALEAECTRLRARGADMSVLSGGLNAWQARGHSLDGTEATASDLSRIEPISVYQALRTGQWTVVDVSRARDPGAVGQFPQSIWIPFDPGDVAPFAKAMRSRMKGSGEATRVLLTDGQGELARQARRELAKTLDVGLMFHLGGGTGAYSEALRNMGAMNARKTVRQTGARMVTSEDLADGKPCDHCPGEAFAGAGGQKGGGL